MKPGYHIAFSSLIAGVLYMTTRSWAAAAASLMSGIFVDMDHVYEVLREHGRPFSIEKMFRICYTCDFRKIILPLHGWEWLFLALITAWATDWHPVAVGILAGYSHHMVLDALHNSPHILSYSLAWRWGKGFDYDEIFGARLPRKRTEPGKTPSCRTGTPPGFMLKLSNFLNRLY